MAAAIGAGLIISTGGAVQATVRHHHHHGPPPPPPPVTTTTVPGPGPVPGGGTLKPSLAGLIDINGNTPAVYQVVVHNQTLKVNWADLEPTQGTLNTSTIDARLAKARPNGTHLLLRILAGANAPDWAKNIGGAPFPMLDPNGGQTGTVGRWWLPAYGAAWQSLNQRLGAKYDSEPLISEVTIGEAGTIFAEPFQRGGTSNRSVLIAAGYTEALDVASETRGIDDTCPAWPTTRCSLALTVYQSQFNGGEPQVTLAAATYGKATYKNFMTENNGLRMPRLAGRMGAIYAWMQANGPTGGQTATAPRIGSLVGTLNDAASMGIVAVELPGGYESLAAPTDLETPRASLALNAAKF